MFTKKTIRDIDLKGKTVLMRADYNVPLENGKVLDDYRIRQSLPTVNYLLSKDVKLIICSHVGRPAGKPEPGLSMAPIAQRLGALLDDVTVRFVPACTGEKVEQAVRELKHGQVLVLENVRFYPEEEANDEHFARQLASLADIFVQDAFGVVHHPSVSVSELPKFLPGVAGQLLEKEVDTITTVMEQPKRPMMALIGGAKISDKIEVMDRFIHLADVVAIGGAMANTFLAAQGFQVASSLVERDALGTAKKVMELAAERAKSGSFTFALPFDAVVATEINDTAQTRVVTWDSAAHEQLHPDERILDIGPATAAHYRDLMQSVSTVVWNGTMGVAERKPFAHGTELLVRSMLGLFGHRPFTVVGGGDTVSYLEQRKLATSFDHVSTGGGASLELMAGRKLPGVEALQDK